jgi:hypothetical protein
MQAPNPSPPVLVIGAVCGFVSTVGIYFVPSETGKPFILAAGTLRGAVVALLVALTAGTTGTWVGLMGWGALYGAVLGSIIGLSHGQSAPRHVLYIAPPSAAAGLLSGVLTKLLLT